MSDLYYEVWCTTCGYRSTVGTLRDARSCPQCQKDLEYCRYITCCGRELELTHFTNTCVNCGTDYNLSGQRLAGRDEWGEETGEHPVDIINMTEPWDDNY